MNKINGGVNEALEISNLKELITYRAEKSPDHIAFVNITRREDISYTYKQFKIDVEALGSYFFSKGIKNKKVALIGKNSYEWLVSFFAITNGNNSIVPMNKDMNTDELVKKIKQTNCEILIYCSQSYSIDETIKRKLKLDINQYINMVDFQVLYDKGRKLIENGYEEYINYPIDKKRCAVILLTSGTTSVSKCVMLSHENIASNIRNIGKYLLLEGSTLLALPLHHAYGLVACVGTSMLYGTTIYINDSLKYFFQNLKRINPSYLFLVPLFVEMIYKNIQVQFMKLNEATNSEGSLELVVNNLLGTKLKFVISGGAMLHKKYCYKYEELGIALLNGYGITECSPVISVNLVQNNKYGTIGIPLQESVVRIDQPDEEGRGEICVKGLNVMLGYYNMEKETKEILKDGWFYTGDLGYIDRDGFLWITGRKNNLIILSNGENISAEEMEENISNNNNVNEVIVYAEDDLLCAEIYPNFSAEDTNIKSELEHWILEMNKNLPVYKQVKKIKIRDTEFPKTVTNKIIR